MQEEPVVQEWPLGLSTLWAIKAAIRRDLVLDANKRAYLLVQEMRRPGWCEIEIEYGIDLAAMTPDLIKFLDEACARMETREPNQPRFPRPKSDKVVPQTIASFYQSRSNFNRRR